MNKDIEKIIKYKNSTRKAIYNLSKFGLPTLTEEEYHKVRLINRMVTDGMGWTNVYINDNFGISKGN